MRDKMRLVADFFCFASGKAESASKESFVEDLCMRRVVVF